jgi:hypothetical protein
MHTLLGVVVLDLVLGRRYTHPVQGGRHSIPPKSMLECASSYGNSKLGSGCQQHSNYRSSMMYGSDLGSIHYP